ncbi:Putative tartrate transporter [Sodalis praecaptivus]|nr:Putative tartrate transporter [Sodalis praecaptivus]
MNTLASVAGKRSDDIESKVVKKIMLRILPFLMLGYFIAFMDRVNIGFAAVQMNASLGFTSAVYGVGAGIFFIGYFLFEVPSNLAMHRFGARVWIARIMITWGLISGLTVFVRGEYSFFIIRFLLGMAEAGFFPGVVYYFSYWLLAKNRAKVLSVFYLAVPFAVVFGSLISAPLLMMHGLGGLEGWQWLFIIEALPAVILGVYLFFRLKDKPEQATWLDDEEKAWLTETLNNEKANLATPGQHRLGQVFSDPRVIKLSLVYFGMNFAGVGLIMFLPQIVAGFGSALSWVGVIAAIPYFVAAVLLPLIGRYSDRHPGNRAVHSGCSAAAVAIGLALCVFISHPVVMLLLICLAAVGIYAFAPPFWALCSNLFAGSASAEAIAVINSVGNLGGFAGPFVMGWLRDTTGSFAFSLLAIAAGPALAAIGLELMKRRNTAG